MQKIAEHDNRIVLLSNKRNCVWEPGNTVFEIAKNHDNSDYLCVIDADDEYKPDFLRKMLAFITENKLDIAISGNDFIDAQTNRLFQKRELTKNLIIQDDGFSEMFPAYHQFMRTLWSKLFSVAVLKKLDKSRVPPVLYGWDTLFVQEAMRNASRVGILAGTLYKYYTSQNTRFSRWNAGRIEADRVLNRTAHEYLVDKHGYVSPQNEEFLLRVYMNTIKDTLNVLFQSSTSYDGRLKGVLDIFSYGYTKQLAAREQFGIFCGYITETTRQRTELFSSVAKWLLSLQEVPDEQMDDFCNVGEFVCAVAQNGEGWVFFNKLRVSFLTEQKRLTEAQTKLKELEELLPNDGEIIALRKKLNELKNAPLSD